MILQKTAENQISKKNEYKFGSIKKIHSVSEVFKMFWRFCEKTAKTNLKDEKIDILDANFQFWTFLSYVDFDKTLPRSLQLKIWVCFPSVLKVL